MLAENKIVQSLWVGPKLSPMEQLSIRSFLRHGHEFHLFTYGPVDNVPEGVVLKDANAVIPLSLRDYKAFPKLALFADFFRYKLLLDRGGWWVDTDTICIRPFDFTTEYVFSSEAQQLTSQPHINNGNIKAPAGSAIMRHCWETCLASDPARLQWAQSGPALIAPAVVKFGLERYVQSPEALCPVPWWDVAKFYDPTVKLALPDAARAIHLWGNMWTSNKQDRNKFPVGSPYEKLRNEIMDAAAVKLKLNDVTAVIKTFLRDDSLFYCVKSLKEHYPDIRIIVADDGYCSKEKGDKLRALGVENYIEMPWNRGLSAGRNALVAACKTPYLLLCDDDFSFTKDSHLERLRTLMDVADIAAGQVFNVRHWTLHPGGQGWDPFGGCLVQKEGRFWRTGFRGEIQTYRGVSYEKADLVLNFFMGRVASIKKVGGWDTDLFLACEHQDFFMRAYKMGVKTVRTLDVQVIHKKLEDVSPEFMRIRGDYEKYEKVFVKKWGYALELLPATPPSPQIVLPPPVPMVRPTVPAVAECPKDMMEIVVNGRHMKIHRPGRPETKKP